MISYEKLKELVDKFNIEVGTFLDENTLVELKSYKELQNKDVIGTVYRHDQWYFENVSNFKAKYFGIKSYFLKLKETLSDRVTSRKIDTYVSMIDEKTKMLDTHVFTSRQRIRFYQDVIFIISNRTYGDL